MLVARSKSIFFSKKLKNTWSVFNAERVIYAGARETAKILSYFYKTSNDVNWPKRLTERIGGKTWCHDRQTTAFVACFMLIELSQIGKFALFIIFHEPLLRFAATPSTKYRISRAEKIEFVDFCVKVRQNSSYFYIENFHLGLRKL